MIEVDVDHVQGDFRLSAAFTGPAGVTALFGPSGSGKSTLVHLIAGLKRPRRGRIVLDGTVLADVAAGIHVPVHRRRIGLVFQDSQLFPHMSVRQNLLYGRAFRRGDADAPSVERVVGALGIADLVRRRPASLSGGERQRVALGRALLASPRLLLMDEPLAALDAARKAEVLGLIEDVRDTFGVPIVYVSHSVEEVVRLAGTVVLIEGGRVRATGDPATVLSTAGSHPENRFEVLSLVEGVLAAPETAYGLTPVDLPAGRILVAGLHGPGGRSVRVAVRATDVAIALAPPVGLSIRTVLSTEVAAITPVSPTHVLVALTLVGGGKLSAMITRLAADDLRLRPGLPVHALIKTAALDERMLTSLNPNSA